jgi:hypothetical protein
LLIFERHSFRILGQNWMANSNASSGTHPT